MAWNVPCKDMWIIEEVKYEYKSLEANKEFENIAFLLKGERK